VVTNQVQGSVLDQPILIELPTGNSFIVVTENFSLLSNCFGDEACQ
jgi:hypothetical protein